MPIARKQFDKPALLGNLPMEEYHADRSHHSKTLIAAMGDSPAHYLHARDGVAKKVTDGMRFGCAAHLYLSDPEAYSATYFLMSDDVKRDKRTAAYKEILALANGRETIKCSEHARVEGIAASLVASPIAREILRPEGLMEATMLWDHAGTDMPLKTRPDVLYPAERIAADYKMTTRADREGFERIAYDKHYDVSAAMCSAGFEAVYGKPLKHYYFIAIETDAPHVVSVFDAMQSDSDGVVYAAVGMYRLNEFLVQIEACTEANVWPGYLTDVAPMSIPSYEIRKLEKELETV